MTSRRTILATDDSPLMLSGVSEVLRSAGFEVLEASDGLEALDQLEKSRVHLLITDLNMPRLDGIELTRRVRALPQYRFLPILMLSSETRSEMVAEARNAGASGWIAKPFSAERLVSLVRRVLP